jgi:cysteine-rich repeat protein
VADAGTVDSGRPDTPSLLPTTDAGADGVPTKPADSAVGTGVTDSAIVASDAGVTDSHPPADAPYVPTCGDGIRDPMEACDDGNTTDMDGCSPNCVIEPEYLQPFVPTALSLNGAWMAVAQSGTIYVKESGGGGGVDSIYAINGSAVVTPNAVAGILSTYGGSIVTVGNDLYSCGNYIQTSTTPQHNHTTCQKWAGGSGTPSTVFDQMDIGFYYSAFTTNAGGSTFWMSTIQDAASDFRRSTGVSSSLTISSSIQGSLAFHPTYGAIIANGSNIMAAPSVAGTYATANSLSAGSIGTMVVDGNGIVWASCYTAAGMASNPCASGSVWMIDIANGVARPAIDNFAMAQGLGFDPTGKYIVLLSQGKIWRFKW